MPKNVCPTLGLLLLTVVFSQHARAQRMYFNTSSNVYEITGTSGNFSFRKLGHYCLLDTNDIENSAMHGDTLYLMTPDNEIYQILISTGSCRFLTNFTPGGFSPPVNNLTCDKNGLLYFLSINDLYRYDPHTDTYVELGKTPAIADGDMLFFNDMLLCSANGPQIWQIDINNPANSSLLMSTGSYQFWGLYAVPNNCQQNRLYGLSSAFPAQIIEIDPQTWTIKGVAGEIPMVVLDGASMAEDGGVKGLILDSLALLSPCGDNTLGSLQAFASSAPDGGTNYTLDGTTTNTTGIFTNIATGTHSIHIEASSTCTVDSVFTLNQGLSTVAYQISSPPDCAHLSDGDITVTANSQALPIFYSLNGIAQSSPDFASLDTGSYTLSISDAGHCGKDTTILLAMQHILPFPATLTITPAYCQQPTGGLSITLNPDVDPATFTSSMNDGTPSSGLSFSALNAGTDHLKVENTPGCVYDTVIDIPSLYDPAPMIQATIRDQHCFADDGGISLSITGPYGPYTNEMNGGAPGAGNAFNGLAPGAYTFHILDARLCGWDTSFTIQPYPRDSLHYTIDQTNPVCTQLNSGSLTISIQGDQAPYWLEWGSSSFANGSTISQLGPGDLSLPVINGDGCIVDSAHVHLTLDIKPECNTIYLPGAFSPNGDGTNDLFRVLHNPYLTTTQLRVFNRYGGLVFTSSDQNPGWDGRFQGQAQPAGIYVWEASYIDLEKNPRTTHGTVLLIR